MTASAARTSVAFVGDPATVRPLDETALRAWCRARLAGFKVPREITKMDALPRNATGKIFAGQLKTRRRDGLSLSLMAPSGGSRHERSSLSQQAKRVLKGTTKLSTAQCPVSAKDDATPCLPTSDTGHCH